MPDDAVQARQPASTRGASQLIANVHHDPAAAHHAMPLDPALGFRYTLQTMSANSQRNNRI